MPEHTEQPRDYVLVACHCCGLVQARPPRVTGPLSCTRCRSRLPTTGQRQRLAVCGAWALAGLLCWPAAMTMPVMAIERLGHRNEASVLTGSIELFKYGDWIVGLVVVISSILIPLAKLIALLVVSLIASKLGHETRAWTWRLVEWTGRWGMLDVLLVALLVAFVKLGDLVAIETGPGAYVFGVMVFCSLLASASCRPEDLWAGDRAERQPGSSPIMTARWQMAPPPSERP